MSKWNLLRGFVLLGWRWNEYYECEYGGRYTCWTRNNGRSSIRIRFIRSTMVRFDGCCISFIQSVTCSLKLFCVVGNEDRAQFTTRTCTCTCTNTLINIAITFLFVLVRLAKRVQKVDGIPHTRYNVFLQ